MKGVLWGCDCEWSEGDMGTMPVHKLAGAAMG